MKKEYSQKNREYSAPTLDRQEIFLDVICLSCAGATENYEVDNNFEW